MIPFTDAELDRVTDDLREPETARLREHIEQLDQYIIVAIQARTYASEQVQRWRMSGGGTRTDLQQERRVLERYRESLGVRGGPLAEIVLNLSRGEL